MANTLADGVGRGRSSPYPYTGLFLQPWPCSPLEADCAATSNLVVQLQVIWLCIMNEHFTVTCTCRMLVTYTVWVHGRTDHTRWNGQEGTKSALPCRCCQEWVEQGQEGRWDGGCCYWGPVIQRLQPAHFSVLQTRAKGQRLGKDKCSLCTCL